MSTAPSHLGGGNKKKMAEDIFIMILMMLLKDVKASNMEGFIVGGHMSKINMYAHSAFLEIRCFSDHPVAFGCGSSIVNQGILLTAAHCFDDCVKSTSVTVHVGNANKYKGFVSKGKSYKVHENYDKKTVTNDIALVRLTKELVLGKSVKRVLLLRAPPYQDLAAVAGWGMTDDVKQTGTFFLKDICHIHVLNRKTCLKVLKKMPIGTFCAGENRSDEYVARGDSGSAIIVRKFIQIGLVSFKYPSFSKSVAIYTDVGYFYDWIHTNAEKLYCKMSKGKDEVDLTIRIL